MVMKRIGKMKQKKGAVLFAVIAVMALLIAMSTTAYYTARSAYNSVVSNYDYSQLYLSAISVSDMISEAITNHSVISATGETPEGVHRNDYESLRDLIFNNMETPQVTAGDGASKIVVYSNGISETQAMDLKANQEAILESLADKDSLIAGIVDGVVVEITLIDNTNSWVVPEKTNSTTTTKRHEYKYSFKTTAFYRDNFVTVEDIITTQKESTETIPGGGPSFNTFFTATGQELGIDAFSGSTGIKRASRIVTISSHEISDDAFYQNDHTFFTNGNDNKFLGSITTTGSIYLDKFTADIKGSDNDWYIGEDLVILGANANNLNLRGNDGTLDNNLYVGRDLVLSGQNPSITAKDIYVEGDLYLIGNQATINGNLHVNGNIYYQMEDGVYDEKGNKVRDSATTVAKNNGYPASATEYNTPANPWTVTGSLDVNGSVNLKKGDEGNLKFNVGGTSVEIPTGKDASDNSDLIGEFNSDDIIVEVTTNQEDKDSDTFVETTEKYTVKDAIANQTGTIKEYDNYTSKSSAYDTTIKVDFSKLEPEYNEAGQVIKYSYTDESTGLTIETASGDSNSEVTVKLPYKADGYILDIADIKSLGSGGSLGGNANIKYEIETGDETCQIVLKGNIDIKDDSGNVTGKGFSWKGDKYDSNDSGVKVIAKGDGNVVFEMANTEKGDTTGKPVQYNYNNYKNYDVVQYVAARKEVVGNEKQVDKIGWEGKLDEGIVNGMLQPGTSKPLSEYDNQIILVSNANGTIAVDAARQGNAFCGYVYAPNGIYNNKSGDGAAPVFGGMIVSTYTTNLAKLFYAEPRPSKINEMLGSMLSSTEQKPPPGDDADPTRYETDEWTWAVQGSNYVN